MTVVSDYRALLSSYYWYPIPDTTLPYNAGSQPIVLTYSFSQAATDSVQSSNPAAAATFEPFSAADQAIAQAALAQWSAVSGITFIETSQAQGDITFGYYSLSTMSFGESVGLGYYPNAEAYINSAGVPVALGGYQPVSGDIYVDTSYAGNASLQTDLAHVLVHEIGHALGLKHPFDAGAYSSDPANYFTLTPALDNGDNTVMSYTGARNATLGPLDVAAIQYLYGNFGDAPTDWTWSWNATSETYTVHAIGDAVYVRGVSALHDVVYAPGLNDAVVTQQGNDVIYAAGQALSVNAGPGNDTVYTGLTYASLLQGVGGTGDFRYIYLGGGVFQQFYSVESLVFSDGTYNTTDSSFTPEASLAIAALNAVRAEGTGGTTAFTFTVTRTGSISLVGTVAWLATGASSGPSAAAGDFAGGVAPQGTLTFAAGVTSQTLTVYVNGDTLAEPDEGFRILLGNPSSGFLVATASASGTILNDDTNFSVVSVTGSHGEGNSGATPFLFTVTRTGITTAVQTVRWTTVGSAPASVGPNDFVGGVVPAGTLTFAAGVTSQTITVNVQGDTLLEPDEYFRVQLGGATGGASILVASALAKIVNDDSSFSIVADNPVQLEGNSGATDFVFTVTRNGSTAGTHSIAWLATGMQPNSVGPADFVAGSPLSGGLIFAPGETTKTITIEVQGDTLVEPDEHFMVLLRNASAGAAIAVNNAQATILNDDGPAPSADAGAGTVLARADLTGDGVADTLRGTADGALYVLDGATGRTGLLSRSTIGMRFVAAADFSGRGQSALLMEGANGVLSEWTVSGARFEAASDLVRLAAGTTVAAVTDLTGDGRADILLHDGTAGAADPWTLLAMDGGTIASRSVYATAPSSWHLG